MILLPIRVGVPRGLLYYQYGLVWERFLQELGVEVVVSGETSKATLDCGSALDEVCLPVKVYFGHVYELHKQVDFLFIPRLISVSAGQYTCPKIIGVSDMLRSNVDHLPPLIDVNLNLRQNKRDLYQAIITVGRTLGSNNFKSLYAWIRAWKYWQQQQIAKIQKSKSKCIGLIGHPYIIYDRQISMNIIDRLDKLGIDVITPEMVNENEVAASNGALAKQIFWSNGSHMTGAALALMQSKQPIDGLIFLTSFACGPDALIGELISQHAQDLNIPCMLLTVDEHTAEAGFVTRLEAFTDMLVRRKRS